MAGRILITGGSGFIGTHLVQALLDAGREVLSLDLRRPAVAGHVRAFRRLDLCDREAVLEAAQDFGPTALIHLAARTDLARDATADDYAVNVQGTDNLLDAAAVTEELERLLLVSSMLVCRPGHVPQGDDDYAPDTPYGESKVEMERRVRARDLPATWALLRPVSIWGPGHPGLERGLYRLIRLHLYTHPAGRPCRRSFGYVGNVVHQLLALLEAPREELYRRTLYLGDPAIELERYVDGLARRLRGRPARRAPYKVLEAAARAGDAAARLTGREPPLTLRRLRNMTSDNVLDVAPILALAGPGPFTLEQGIDATAAWLERRRRS